MQLYLSSLVQPFHEGHAYSLYESSWSLYALQQQQRWML